MIRPSCITATRSLFGDDLLDVAADHHDRRSLVSEPSNQAMDLGLGADVDALRRFVEDMTRGSSASHLPSTTFCWLPPLSVADRRFDGGVFDRQLGGDLRAALVSAARLTTAKRAYDPSAGSVMFSRTRHRRDDAPAAPILWNQADARADRVARRVDAPAAGRRAARDRTTAATTPQIGFGQLRASGADQAGDAEHLAAVDGQRHFDIGVARVRTRSMRSSRRRRRPLLRVRRRRARGLLSTCASDHQLHETIARDLAARAARRHCGRRAARRRGRPALRFPSGDARCTRSAMPLARRSLQHVKQPFGFARAEAGRRLVDDEEPRLHRQRAGDRDELLLRRWTAGRTMRARRDRAPMPRELPLRVRVHAAAIEQTQRPARCGSRPRNTLPATSSVSMTSSS